MLNHAPVRAAGHESRPGVRGFTLVELVVAITLLGLLIAFGLPSFTAMIRNSQVRTVAEGLQNGVRLAQAEAVRRNRQVMFSLTNAQPALNAASAANGKNWSMQTVGQFGEAAEFIQGGALADVASAVAITGPASICFNSNGRLVVSCNAGAAAFDLSQASSDRPLRVTVALAGQVRMCDPNRPALSASAPDGCP